MSLHSQVAYIQSVKKESQNTRFGVPEDKFTIYLPGKTLRLFTFTAMKNSILYLLLFAGIISSCNNDDPKGDNPVTNTIPPPAPITFQVLKVHPHDTAAFTQGLIYYNGTLYESTGNPDSQPGAGWVGTADLASGKQTKKVTLPADIFGEGITILNGKIYQITWRNQKGFVYDATTFQKIREFSYRGEGWGITNDGTSLIVSDGSSNIYYWNPETLKEEKKISIQDQNGLKNNINELEFINGFLFANVWQTQQILKIDTASGNVVGVIDLSELIRNYPELATPPSDVLNGIAWDSTQNRLFITGKRWSRLFEIKLN